MLTSLGLLLNNATESAVMQQYALKIWVMFYILFELLSTYKKAWC